MSLQRLPPHTPQPVPAGSLATGGSAVSSGCWEDSGVTEGVV